MSVPDTNAFGDLSAALADRYELLRELGRGGMATVYLARDVRHARQVAIKVLHPELAAVLGAERFLAEITTTANLQHPHILPLFDSGTADGQLFYVMPFVEGETLRARLDRETQLPIVDAVQLAREVADALQYAHERGVIHRDIKPENILLQGGHALVADFGIALAVQHAGGQRMTQTGLSLGTPQYMAPEQAMGEKTIDARADIYALGAVTYEMLAGEPPFTGPTAQAIVARVLTVPPAPIVQTRSSVPSHLEHAVMTALAKLPADRFTTAAAFGGALVGSSGSRPPLASQPETPAPASSWKMVAIGMTLVSAVLVTVIVMQPASSSVRLSESVVQFALDVPDNERMYDAGLGSIAVSDSGNQVAYITQAADGLRTYVRRAGDLTPRRLDTKVAGQLNFSPDGRWLAYAEGSEIRKAPTSGGRSEPVGPAPNGTLLTLRGMHWLATDTILAAVDASGWWTIPANGGKPSPFDTTALGASLIFPSLMPGQREAIAVRRRTDAPPSFGRFDLRTRSVSDIPINPGMPLGVVDDHLLFVSTTGVITAVAYDKESGAMGGTQFPLVDEPVILVGNLGAMAALSPGGMLAYVTGSSEQQLALAARGLRDSLLTMEARRFGPPRLSPDGRTIAVSTSRERVGGIWLFDIASRRLTPLVNDRGIHPTWSPDGRHVLFLVTTGQRRALWRVPADNSAAPEKLFEPAEVIEEGYLSPDGQWIVYRTTAPTSDIVAVRQDAPSKAVPLVVGPDFSRMPGISPDGKWLAFQSNRSGREEVYVQPFPGPGAPVAVTHQGGTEPVWSRQGLKLYYRTGDSVMTRTITPTPSPVIGPAIFVTATEMVREARVASYDVTPDDRGIVTRHRAGGDAKGVVVLNVGALIRERARAVSR